MPDLHWGWVSVVSRRNTYLKKRPVKLDDLTNDEKAKIISARAIRRCRVLDRVNDHTHLETGLGVPMPIFPPNICCVPLALMFALAVM